MQASPETIDVETSRIAEKRSILGAVCLAAVSMPLSFTGPALALPAIAAFYAGCTVLSAWQHRNGRGGMWKGRAQAAVGR